MAESTTKRWKLPRLWQACAGIGVGVPSLISGFLKKQVDGELSISEIMVKAHRRKQILSLVTMAAKLRLATTPKS
jgi:hypothetical protein